VNKVVFFHNPQVASIIAGAPVNYLKNVELFKNSPQIIHRYAVFWFGGN